MGYTANFIMELHKREGDEYFIELFLNNEPFNFLYKSNVIRLGAFLDLLK